jgi:hypothetical protein
LRKSPVQTIAQNVLLRFSISSNRISYYVKELEAEFAEYPFRFDLANLTVVIGLAP